MTLITYPTRVHFADDVLEEALHSELEHCGRKTPLLICETTLGCSEFAERVRAGLPRGSSPTFQTIDELSNLGAVAKEIAMGFKAPDVIVAFGTARAIELGRKCRRALSDRAQNQIPFFAIPGIDGLPNPCTRNFESWRAGLPSVLICDPTVTLGASLQQNRRSAVISMIRCLESYLAVAYNPLADGIALDGLNRSVENLPRIGTVYGIDLQRELMAASLNAALSQEKGVGPAMLLARALADRSGMIDEAEVACLILPAVIRARQIAGDGAAILLKIVGHGEATLHQAMSAVLSVLPFAGSLSEMGAPASVLDGAAQAVVGRAGFSYASARALLAEIY